MRLGEAMSEENIQAAAHRRKRVQRLKRYIILTAIFLILLPTMLCIVLFARTRRMDRSLEELTDRVELLAMETTAQQDMLRELLESMQTSGQGSQAENESPREVTGYELTTTEETEESTDPAVTAAHKVYLTFDDGPSANTEEILDILDRYDVKATFFVVGKESEAAKEALVQIVERGHTLGMHSYSHKYAEIYSSVEEFGSDFEKLRSYLEEVTGVTSNVYRFPGGSSNTVSRLDMQVFADYLDGQDVRFFDWNISSGDAGSRPLSVEKLVENATNGIEQWRTSVILMHDAENKHSTVEALPTIIENILAMEDTVILPITEDTEPVQHIHKDNNN